MAESEKNGAFVLALTLDWIDRPADIGGGDIFENLDRAGLRIDLDLCAAPAHLPEGRRRAQNRFFALHVPINAFTDNLPCPAAEIFRNDLIVGEGLSPTR